MERQKLMKTLGEIKQLLEEQKEHLAAEYGVTIVGVFGSYLWKSAVRLPSAYP